MRLEPARQALVRCRYFQLDYVRRSEPFALPGGRMQALLVLHGRGSLLSPAGPEPLAPGDTLLLPAALGDVGLHPCGPLGLLLASQPLIKERDLPCNSIPARSTA
jgi:hypothetical protein